MSFSRLPTQAPSFDATAFVNGLNAAAKKIGVAIPTTGFVSFKRWLEATAEQDAIGLRDVVNANAIALNAVKGDLDLIPPQLSALTQRIVDLEARPAVPFPGSGPPTVGA